VTTLRPRASPSLIVTAGDAGLVASLREWHRREMQCQIVHDSFLRRGFCDVYALAVDGETIGYGLIDHKFHPGSVDEFFVLPHARALVRPLFHQLIETGGATHIRAQTNDRLLLLMLDDCAVDVVVENILFADGLEARLPNPGGTLARLPGAAEEWRITLDSRAVAEGGLLFHYNPPYADIYMEVEEAHRRRGYGSYLVQEMKRIAYELGKIPAARCNADNDASRRTLERAGMLPCGRILRGTIRR
jgi:GNAT superfamily N-acetyltransferase